MPLLTESQVEELALGIFGDQEYAIVHGPAIAPEIDGGAPLLIADPPGSYSIGKRNNYSSPLLEESLRRALERLNPSLPPEAREQTFKAVTNVFSPQLVDANETFHRMLTEGVSVIVNRDGQERGEKVWLVDFRNPENNDFVAVNQFTVIERNQTKRPDILLFINGLPLVVVELKNPGDEKATIRKAFDQVQTYKTVIPSLFFYNAFIVISDGLEARTGTISSPFSRFMAWKSKDGIQEASTVTGQLEVLLHGMLNKKTLLDIIRNFIVFEEEKKTDPKSGITTVETVKKLAAYHQYYAVNKALASTRMATAENGNRKAGVIWHTQGSGKSLSMVFYTGKLVSELDNPTVVVITDRNDLDDQLFDTFAGSTQLLRQTPVQAKSREHLKELLKVASGGIVFTTIQKFFPEDESSSYDQLSSRRNIIVIADEAHRTQYGFKPKLVDTRDSAGTVTGKRVSYGFAKYLRDALPNATFIGFTGTPIESTDVNTPAVFGNYIDIYDIAQAMEDRATVKIYYESRLAKINLTEEGRRLIEEFEKETDDDGYAENQKARAKWTKLEAIIGHPERLKNLARDIVEHYEKRAEVFAGKAMVVAMSRRIAVALYDEIIKLRPEWHSKDLNSGVIKVVMTSSSSDKIQYDPEDPDALVIPVYHRTNKADRRVLSERMKDPEDPLKIVIVRDMWLTGFDVPCLHTMYIDKPMKGHTLMQAIARVNRVFMDKPGGLTVDYIGIGNALKKALAFYANSGGHGDPAETQDKAVGLMLEKLEVVRQMFHGFDYSDFFAADTSRSLSIILQAEEFILGQENGKERFLKEITALSKLFALAVPRQEAMLIKDEVAFFQAVKARIQKLSIDAGGGSDTNYETTIRQIINQSLASNEVVDIFDAAGIQKPEISLLSEEFLLEVKDMKHKNLAIELLKKILNDEITVRSSYNLMESKRLLEMLEKSIKKYQNNLLSTAEIIEELIEIAKGIRASDDLAGKLKLTKDEFAFYSALETNDSAVSVLGDETLRTIAREIADKVRKNATIDWTMRESARAKLMVIVKRTLNKYGYPPDKQPKAVETVLKQAEVLADYWTGQA